MLRSVWASSATDVWIGGTGQLLRFDGTSWTKEFPPNEVDAIWGSGPQDVWVSQSTSMLHWDGANWTSWASGLGLVSRLWGSGPLDVYAVSYFGAAHWDGMSWSPVAGLGGLEWRDVSGTSPSDVWVVGNSEMRQWDGQSWASVSTPMTCASSAYYCAVLASPGGVWASLAGALYQRQGTNWVKNGPGAATRIRIAGSTVGIIGDRRILRRYP
jgi:hypothetical protein